MNLGVIAALGFVVAFLMSWLVQPHFRNLGFLTEIVDHPGYRRPHREPVPRTGGMAIFISFFCALFFLENIVLRTPLPWSWLGILIGAGLAILALGVGDDRFGIHAEKKLYGQLVVIVILMLFGQRIETLLLPGIGIVELGGWAWPFTLFWYLGFINSMNLIDGLDGLASGISILASLALVTISMAVGQMFSMLFASALCGATVAFFYWNISSRKIFLGDSGSMWMGLVLASLTMNLGKQVGLSLPVMLAPMIVPIWDTGTTIFRRFRSRTSIFQADDYHLHHRLLRLGFSPRGAVICLLAITAGTILFSLSGFLNQTWLGLPGMVAWMWAAQLGAQRHLSNRELGLDLFTEILYVLGFTDRLDQIQGDVGQDVADIIDLQSARREVARPVVLEGTTGESTGEPTEGPTGIELVDSDRDRL
ncbi:MAG: undecaprenyl/decaprenyl-phosphate alpha-N-acetylglucosaminyl 1-phosphate transferase [Gemmatimonadales bacterium]|nr:undecaprenyl/decaprenyl-phosphate alpha-N-acetylglucosaminyl 1-phosphate transferase [Gemmatimonadales bacterium]